MSYIKSGKETEANIEKIILARNNSNLYSSKYKPISTKEYSHFEDEDEVCGIFEYITLVVAFIISTFLIIFYM